VLASLVLEAIGQKGAAHAALWRRVINDALPGVGDAVVGSRGDGERWGVWELFPDNVIFRKIYGRTDYSQANSTGSRGVRVWYSLYPGRYLVHAPESWGSTDRYICRVMEGGEIVREATLGD